MIISLSIFIFSLLALGVFFGLRIRGMRKGLVVEKMDGESYEHISDALNIDDIKNRLRVLLQMWGRKLLLVGLKYSIKTTHFIKRKLDVLFTKVHKKIVHHHNKIVARENASVFLEEIGKHKEEIRKKTEV